MTYYDSSPSVASQRKYKYAATSALEMDASSLQKGKGYWVYANQAGNLTLPDVGGSLSNDTYAWSKLRFRNASGVEMNVTDARDAGWIQQNLQYWDNGFKLIRGSINPLLGKSNISSWDGVFVYSYQDNITLIRQN